MQNWQEGRTASDDTETFDDVLVEACTIGWVPRFSRVG
jgi:hypothetical protein